MIQLSRLVLYSFFFMSITFVFIILFTNCKGEKGRTEASDKSSHESTEGYVLPDSINTSLLVAAYHETDNEGYSLILFDDATKQTASKITYKDDSATVTDRLKPIGLHEFKSDNYDQEYIIEARSVVLVHRDKSPTNFATLSSNRTFQRIDSGRTDKKDTSAKIYVKSN